MKKVWLNGLKVVEHRGKNMRNDRYGYAKLGFYTEIHDERTIYIDNIYIFQKDIGVLKSSFIKFHARWLFPHFWIWNLG